MTNMQTLREVPLHTAGVIKTRTVCGYCGVGCSVDILTKSDRIIGIQPAMDGPANQGALCVKGQFAYDYVHHPDRLKHPLVREASVIGRPDREWGEIVVAYVVGSAKPDELDALCLGEIARFKRPKDYVFVPALPKNNYGKILKTELRKMDAKR